MQQRKPYTRHKHTHYGPDDINFIINEYNGGARITTIANKMRRSYAAIEQKVSKLRLAGRISHRRIKQKATKVAATTPAKQPEPQLADMPF